MLAGRGARLAARAGKPKMMWEALREAVDEEMEADPTVLVMGMLLAFHWHLQMICAGQSCGRGVEGMSHHASQ